MYRSGFGPRLQLVLLCCLMARLPCARASLGGDASSVVFDAAQLNGALQQPTPNGSGMALLISVDNGISVHEYLDSTGFVFAVEWSGPALPNLNVLLGNYFSPYSAGLAALAMPGRQRAVRIVSADLVVRTAGHLRAYRGVAYLSDRIPVGVTLGDLR